MINVASIDPNTFYSTAEAIKLLHKSNAWFSQHRWKGTGPKCSKGVVPVLYKGADLLNWLESRSAVTSAA
jgi:hypothetical protein